MLKMAENPFFELFRTEKTSGQALVEFAVFGAVLLMVLGVIVNYGLRYNLQQKAQMTTFRRALKMASDIEKGTGASSVIQYKHIPDVTDPFGTGSLQMFSSSSQVTRDPLLHTQAVEGESIQSTVMDIQTTHSDSTDQWMRRRYKTAGFRVEHLVTPSSVSNPNPQNERWGSKYKLIYGTITTWQGTNWGRSSNSEGRGLGDTTCIHWYWVDFYYYNSSSCPAPDTLPNVGDYDPVSGCFKVCTESALNYMRIVDNCIGEIIALDSCYEQARMLVDPYFCTRKCELDKVPGSQEDCQATCSQKTNPPNQGDNPDDPNDASGKSYDPARGGAWYAADYTWEACNLPDGTQDRCYTFPYLYNPKYKEGSTIPEEMIRGLFQDVVGIGLNKLLGLQPNAVINQTKNQTLDKTETSNAITTHEQGGWASVVNRRFLFQENLCPKNDPPCQADPLCQLRYQECQNNPAKFSDTNGNLFATDLEGYEIPRDTPQDFVNVQETVFPMAVSGSKQETWETQK